MSRTIPHSDAVRAVMATVDIMANSPACDDSDVVRGLERLGYSTLHAEKLCAFVPCAFGWILLQKMGLERFPDRYVTKNHAGADVELPIANEHYFTAALYIAHEALEHGWSSALTKGHFERVVTRSAEVGLANQVANAGVTLRGAVLSPPRLLGLTAEEADENR